MAMVVYVGFDFKIDFKVVVQSCDFNECCFNGVHYFHFVLRVHHVCDSRISQTNVYVFMRQTIKFVSIHVSLNEVLCFQSDSNISRVRIIHSNCQICLSRKPLGAS